MNPQALDELTKQHERQLRTWQQCHAQALAAGVLTHADIEFIATYHAAEYVPLELLMRPDQIIPEKRVPLSIDAHFNPSTEDKHKRHLHKERAYEVLGERYNMSANEARMKYDSIQSKVVIWRRQTFG